LVIEYDFAIRRNIADLLNEGHAFVDALEASQKDKYLRDLYFTTPLMASAVARAVASMSSSSRGRSRSPKAVWKPTRRPTAPPPPVWQPPAWSSKGGGKGKGNKGKGGDKGGGKGAGKAGAKGSGKENRKGPKFMKGRTGDGRYICFAFNTEGQGCAGSCGMVHVCASCESSSHEAFSSDCPSRATAPAAGFQ
jgi:hypothetical protein